MQNISIAMHTASQDGALHVHAGVARLFHAVFLAVSLICSTGLCAGDSPTAAERPDETLPEAARPTPRPPEAQIRRWAGAGFWDRRHAAKLAEIAVGPKEYDCVFVGDSITHNWEGWVEKADIEVAERLYANGGLKFPNGPGRAVWEEMKKKWRVLNLGMAGDSTQNVLWRLDHGELDGYRTRCVFLMIGTNNGRDTPENRARGIKAILGKIAEKQPQATILLSPIFPSGARPDDPLRVSKDRTNSIIRGYADGKRIVWVDFNSKFLNPDGTIIEALMPDCLHPLEEGYRIWFDAIKTSGVLPVHPQNAIPRR